MYWLQTTTPSTLPVTVAEAKKFARIPAEFGDTLVESLITAAVEHVEAVCWRAVMPQTWELYLDEWPEDDIIKVPRPRLVQVNSIKYIDTDGNQQTLSSSKYQVDTKTEPGRIKPAYGEVWPSIRENLSAIEINFDNGWADADSVPQTVKLAIWMLVTHWYENRETVVVGTITKALELAVEALLDKQKVRRFD